MAVCPRCKLPTIKGFDYCPHCHKKLENKTIVCEKCRRKIEDKGWPKTVCIYCGHANIHK